MTTLAARIEHAAETGVLFLTQAEWDMMSTVVEDTNAYMSAYNATHMLTPGVWPPLNGWDVTVDDERANSDEL